LQIPQVLTDQQRVFGSAKDLPNVDCNRVMTLMPIDISAPKFDCAEAIRMLPWLSHTKPGQIAVPTSSMTFGH
jgi:hypothetical protein